MIRDLTSQGRDTTALREKSLKIKILLADAHHMVRQGIRKLIDCEPDLEVVGETDNGADALRLARELKPDLVIMEARLPRLDSVTVVNRLNNAESSCAVLILTTFEDEGQTLELLKAGASGCIFKTAAGGDLAQAIRMIRAGQFVCDPLVERKLLKYVSRSTSESLNYGEQLSRREVEVLKLAAKGRSNHDIAAYLGLTDGTVKGYFGHLFSKMGVSSRTEAVMDGLKRGWVSLDEE